MAPRPAPSIIPARPGHGAQPAIMTSAAAEMALAYAKRGWPILPLHTPTSDGRCDCGIPACDRPGKHPRTAHGLYDATTNTGTIQDWMTRWEPTNWGIRTGRESGLIFLDVDGDKGFQSMRGLALPMTRIHLTGRGWQAGFSLPLGEDWASATAVLPGIDIRARGGYVVAPPSIHYTGRAYQVYLDAEAAPPPRWLRDLVSETIVPVNAAPVRPDFFPVGERNSQLFRRGCGFARNTGMTEKRLLAWLTGTNRNRCRPPLPSEEVERIARNIWRIVRKGRDGQR